MAHEVETMFSVREVPWHGLGTILHEAPNADEALRLAGLDWTVRQEPVFWGNDLMQEAGQMKKIPAKYANIRSSDDSCLGVVGKNYQILQNSDAFSFTDSLIGGEVVYETAGSLYQGRKVWMMTKLPEDEILGDKIQQYLAFTNTFDGTAPVKAIVTPVRVVCQNTLNMAINGASRIWSARHLGDMNSKLSAARDVLGFNELYMENLRAYAEEQVAQKLSKKQADDFIKQLFQGKDEATERSLKTLASLEEDLRMRFFNAPDLENFRFTKWGMLQALTDHASHKEAARKTQTIRENKMVAVLDGDYWLNGAVKQLELVA